MLTSTFMIGFSILMTYALAIGACMAILQSEFLKKGYIWFYRILIALNVIGITVFIEKCFTVEKIRRENYFLIFASVSYVIFLVQLVWILAGSVKGRCNNQKMVPRETYDLKEEWLETEENIKICYTQKKNEEGFIYEGKKYTMYEGTQLQRQIETEIRKQKDLQIAGKAIADKEMIADAQTKIEILNNKYNEISKISGLPTKIRRLYVAGYRKVNIN